MSWDQLTMNEMRTLLSEAQIQVSSSNSRWKAQLIELCEESFQQSDLLRSLKRFGKLNDANSSVESDNEATKVANQQQPPDIRTTDSSATKQKSRRRSGSNKRRSSVEIIKAAGRFSIPASDAGTDKRKSIRSEKTPSPSRRPTYSSPSSTVLRSAAPPISGGSCFPAVDPMGEPIRWQLRLPNDREQKFYTHQKGSMEHNDQNNNRDSSVDRKSCKSPKKSHQNKRRIATAKRVTVRYGRICGLVLVLVLMMFLYLRNGSADLIIKSSTFINTLRRIYSGPQYCDSVNNNSVDNVVGCVACPDHAICYDGHMECIQPQFQKQWRRGSVSCVKNSDLYRIGYQLLGTLADFLAQQRGFQSCHDKKSIHSDGFAIPLFDGTVTIGFTKCSLSNILSNLTQNGLVGKSHSPMAAVDLLFNELVNVVEDQDQYGMKFTSLWFSPDDLDVPKLSPGCQSDIRSGPTILFYSILDKKTFYCIAREKSKQHLWKILSILSFVAIVRSMYNRYKFNRAAKEAIRQIIVDNTSIQHHSNRNLEYAIGPNVADILNFIQGPIRNSQKWLIWGKSEKQEKNDSYNQYRWLAKHMTKNIVEEICNQLVQYDPSFCRGVMMSDMTTFFYSKAVVDLIRLSSSSNQRSTIEHLN